MFMDWLIYGLLVFGAVTLLNATAFKQKPASDLVAGSLTVLIFVVSVAVLSALKALRYQDISNSIGVPIIPKNPLDMGGAFVLACLFLALLKRQEKNKNPPSE